MSPSKLTVEVWPVTDPGQAPDNEDYVLIFRPTDPDQLRYSGSLYVVADGTGGGPRGQLASRYAAQKVINTYYHNNEPDLGLPTGGAVVRVVAAVQVGDTAVVGNSRVTLAADITGAGVVAIVDGRCAAVVCRRCVATGERAAVIGVVAVIRVIAVIGVIAVIRIVAVIGVVAVIRVVTVIGVIAVIRVVAVIGVIAVIRIVVAVVIQRI